MIRRPPRSTLDRSSAASDVYKRQGDACLDLRVLLDHRTTLEHFGDAQARACILRVQAVSYTHLRAHETVLDLVCRLLLEKTTTKPYIATTTLAYQLHDTHMTTKSSAS